MQSFELWWKQHSKAEASVMTIACLILIFAAGIDIGRALFQATH